MSESHLSAQSVETVLELMASARPDPAAGSAAAVSVALAAALLGKTARLSRRRLDDAEELAEQADALRRRALELAQQDAEVVAAAVGGAKHGIETGSRPDTVAAPVEISQVAGEVQQLAAHLGEHGNPRLLADTEAAHHLAEGAARTARAIVRSNEGELDGSSKGSDDRT